jgi:hypothetical protein
MRFISPSFLTFALLMSLLPWVEIRCEQRAASPFRLSHPVVDQNAFQVAMGDTSFNSFQEQGRRNPQQPQQPQVNPQELKKKSDVRAAPLIAVHLGCVFVGLIVGFAVPARRARLIIMSIVAAGAVGTVLTQIIIGFPLLRIPLDQASLPQLLDQLGVNDPQLRGPEVAYSSGFTIWFYLALLGTAGGAVGVLVDLLNPPKMRPWEEDDRDYEDDRPPLRRRRRPRRYEDDDDYDDDDYEDDYRRRRR